ncbi:MAG: hypothetical protein RJA44_443, partial [Pseudomonadota bacterium]
MKYPVLMLLALASASLISACGGGGGGDSSTTTVQTGPLTLTGVVATGDPVKPATVANKVSVKCRSASGVSAEQSVNLLANGSYAITLQDSSLPCVLQTDTDTKLSSLARGTGPGSAVANITPVTTLVVARVAGKDPVTFYADFSTTSAALITTDGVSTAITAVKNTLTKAGISLTGVVDLITDTVSTDASLTSSGTLDKAVAELVS